MAEKSIHSRIVHKHDTAANWQQATGFTPMAGEIIVYDVDESCNYERLKIGDGIQNVNALPFVDELITVADIDEICASTVQHANEVMF